MYIHTRYLTDLVLLCQDALFQPLTLEIKLAELISRGIIEPRLRHKAIEPYSWPIVTSKVA